mmetsp:Transcript_13438/g.36190  ORF Transcript_13438/g.36190 Transcript_13438/m.36190 type:complete len:99 (+) Transcript_13438:341-637(+)
MAFKDHERKSVMVMPRKSQKGPSEADPRCNSSTTVVAPKERPVCQWVLRTSKGYTGIHAATPAVPPAMKLTCNGREAPSPPTLLPRIIARLTSSAVAK